MHLVTYLGHVGAEGPVGGAAGDAHDDPQVEAGHDTGYSIIIPDIVLPGPLRPRRPAVHTLRVAQAGVQHPAHQPALRALRALQYSDDSAAHHALSDPT